MILSQSTKDAINQELIKQNTLFPDLNFFIRMSLKDNGMYQTYFDYQEKDNDIVIDFDNFVVRVEDSHIEHFKNISVNYEEVEEGKFGFVVSGLGIGESECGCDGNCNEQC
jgi:Fe-S cluster assembly iron-binding protein IscA